MFKLINEIPNYRVCYGNLHHRIAKKIRKLFRLPKELFNSEANNRKMNPLCKFHIKSLVKPGETMFIGDFVKNGVNQQPKNKLNESNLKKILKFNWNIVGKCQSEQKLKRCVVIVTRWHDWFVCFFRWDYTIIGFIVALLIS